MKDQEKVLRGKKSRQAGARFELKVREDLEKKGRIVAKWTNNVEFHNDEDVHDLPFSVGKLVKVKNKFLGPGKPMMLGAGFPDFVVWHKNLNAEVQKQLRHEEHNCVGVFGVESKMNGYLDKQEKEKCKWLLENNIFIMILIASKGEKRGEIVYKEFKAV